jgi:hypothetical protein
VRVRWPDLCRGVECNRQSASSDTSASEDAGVRKLLPRECVVPLLSTHATNCQSTDRESLKIPTASRTTSLDQEKLAMNDSHLNRRTTQWCAGPRTFARLIVRLSSARNDVSSARGVPRMDRKGWIGRSAISPTCIELRGAHGHREAAPSHVHFQRATLRASAKRPAGVACHRGSRLAV